MSRVILPRAVEFFSVFFRKSLEVLRSTDQKRRWKTLSTYVRIKLKSGWLAVAPGRQPDRERLFEWIVSIGNYSDFVYLFEEIFISQSYRASINSPAPVIVDAGANIGLATLYFKMQFPDARIYCVEPEPNAYACLERNVFGNGLANVFLFNRALGNRVSKMEFHFSPFRPASPLAGASRPMGGSIMVDVVPLSSLVDGTVDLIKLDVEGAETEVIKDVVDSGVIDAVEVIILEYHHHLGGDDDHMSQVLALLENAGFGYQVVQARIAPPREYQDLVLYAYRKHPRDRAAV
jgi:FkbM family methyltransferase